MQQLESLVFDKNTQVNAQYQTKVNDVLQNLILLQSAKYKELAELFFVRKTFNVTRFYAGCPGFADFLEKVRLQRLERRQRQQTQRRQENTTAAPERLPEKHFDVLGHFHENQPEVTIPEQ